jgi:hypothetical protein
MRKNSGEGPPERPEVKPIRLPEYPCHDTIEALETLLEDARKGRIKGLAFVTFEKGRTYSMGATGVANDDPVQALGPMLLHLLDLSRRISGTGT